MCDCAWMHACTGYIYMCKTEIAACALRHAKENAPHAELYSPQPTLVTPPPNRCRVAGTMDAGAVSRLCQPFTAVTTAWLLYTTPNRCTLSPETHSPRHRYLGRLVGQPAGNMPRHRAPGSQRVRSNTLLLHYASNRVGLRPFWRSRGCTQ